MLSYQPATLIIENLNLVPGLQHCHCWLNNYPSNDYYLKEGKKDKKFFYIVLSSISMISVVSVVLWPPLHLHPFMHLSRAVEHEIIG